MLSTQKVEQDRAWGHPHGCLTTIIIPLITTVIQSYVEGVSLPQTLSSQLRPGSRIFDHN